MDVSPQTIVTMAADGGGYNGRLSSYDLCNSVILKLERIKSNPNFLSQSYQSFKLPVYLVGSAASRNDFLRILRRRYDQTAFTDGQRPTTPSSHRRLDSLISKPNNPIFTSRATWPRCF